MTWQIAFLLCLLPVIFFLFVKEVIAPDLIALGALVVVTLTGLISPTEAFQSFANEAPITVASMFILSYALQRSGAIEDAGRWIRRLPHLSEPVLLLLVCIVVAGVSAFVNNTPVVVAFLPLVLGIGRHFDIPQSRLLIPLSFAAIFGGTCTLIGTSTNLVVASVAREKYGIDFHLFDITGLGLIMATVGILYVAFIGRHLLPKRESLASLAGEGSGREYHAELLIRPESPLAGKPISQTELSRIPGLRLHRILRNGATMEHPDQSVRLEAGDMLVVGARVGQLMELHMMEDLQDLTEQGLEVETLVAEQVVIAEAIVTNNSAYAGSTTGELRLPESIHATVLALHRFGENITEQLAETRLRFGDALLLRLPEQALAPLKESRDLLLLSDSAIPAARRAKRPIVLTVLAAVVLLAAFNVQPISILALAGVFVLALTRCIQVKEIYDSVDWRIVSMIVGMLALGTAMETTHTATWLAEGITSIAGNVHPVLVLAMFYGMAALLTEMISNNAVAILMCPIAVEASSALGLRPEPFLVAIMFAASASFSTPIGYQTNTFVYGAGNYKFMDFVRIGVPLNLLFWGMAVVLIPLFFPLR